MKHIPGGMANWISARLGVHARRASVLISGQILSQLVPLAVAPILTRLYSPTEYGALNVFGVATLLGTAVAMGRYHMAIVLPKSDLDALQLTHLAFRIMTWACAITFALSLILYQPMIRISLFSSLGLWVFAIPVAVFLSGGYEIATYYCLRHDRTKVMARSSVVRALAGGLGQVGAGATGLGVSGLIGGNVLGLMVGNRSILHSYFRDRRTHPPDREAIRRLASQYRKFPMIELWSNLVVFATYSFMTIGLGFLYSLQTLGHYAIAYRVLALPATFLGTAIGQVYLREAARRADQPNEAQRAFDKTVMGIFFVTVLPFTALALLSPVLFRFLFGNAWAESGLLAAAMLPHVWVRVVVTPVFSVFTIYGRQATASIAYLALFLATVLAFSLAYADNWSVQRLLWTHSIVMSLMYVAMLALARRVVIRGSVAAAERAT